MPAPEIRVEYSRLRRVAEDFGSLAEDCQQLTRRIDDQIAVLVNDKWIGDNADTFYLKMNDHVLQGMDRLAKALVSAKEGAFSVIKTFEEAEDQMQAILNGEDGKSGNFLSRFATGEGWSLLKNRGYQKDEQLTQIDGSCTIYGIMNFLNQRGINISQNEADAILQEMKEKYGVDPKVSGFPPGAAHDILNRYNVPFVDSNFTKTTIDTDGNSVESFDEATAEQFLVDQLEQGKSVYVTTSVDDTFGVASGGHAYNVVGVQKDAAGNVTNFLVSTNWGKDDYRVIPRDAFMDDWQQWRNGNYIATPD